MSINILGISGKLCSGKTTLTEAIINREPRFTHSALAEPLKQSVADWMKVPRARIDERKDIYRPLLQAYGAAKRFEDGPDVWVDALLDDLAIAERIEGDVWVIVDDIRYPNELEQIREAATKSMIVRLAVTQEAQYERHMNSYGVELEPEKMMHHSETSLDTFTDFDMFLNGEAPTDWQATLVLDALYRRAWLEEVAVAQAPDSV